MPRTEDQSIPALLLADYLKTFRPTAYDETHYSTKPDARDIIAAGQHFRRAGNPDPSDAQLEQRGIFKTCANGFAAMGTTEQQSYYDLSLGSGLFYYDWAMQRNIPLVKGGTPFSEISRPHAKHYDLVGGDGGGWKTIREKVTGEVDVLWDMEADPCTYSFRGWPDNGAAQFIWWEQKPVPPATEPWPFQIYWNWNYGTRTRWANIVHDTETRQRLIAVGLYRRTYQAKPCVLWDLKIGNGRTPFSNLNFIE